MSNLQKMMNKQNLSNLAPPPAVIDEAEEEEEEVDQFEDEDLPPQRFSSDDSSSSASSTGTIVPSPSRKLFEKPSASQTARSSRSSPLPWHDFFTQELHFDQRLESSGNIIRHHAYLIPPSDTGVLIVTHHGAGSSGLSFACFATEIRKRLPNIGVLSLDCRDHGETQELAASGQIVDTPADLTLENLSHDLTFIVESTNKKLQWPKLPDILLIGHSLGGAVVVETAHKRLLGDAVLGYAVLDVVEGSAMDALQSMESYLSIRPKSFPSLVSGIEWHIRSRTIRNSLSARVSVPPLLYPESTPDGKTEKYLWRTSLLATQPFWSQWFLDLSSKFLSSRGTKLLILAGTDRLDKELMIGQMQGKYQLQVFPEAGHFVHEDSPQKTADVVAEFVKRSARIVGVDEKTGKGGGGFVMPMKVDEMIRLGKIKGKIVHEEKGDGEGAGRGTGGG